MPKTVLSRRFVTVTTQTSFVVVPIACCLVLFTMATPAHALFEAGAAKVDITPPEGVPLNGYLARMGRGNVGVHDPISVRCLYLDDGETNWFLLSADLCIINRELRDRVLELAPAGVPHERITLTATHNHSGTGAMVKSLMVRTISGRFMPEILEMTAQAFAQAMEQAYQNRKRAALGYGTVEQQVLSVNRRFSNGPIDRQIGVIRVDDSDGNAIAIIANFAAHPTSVPEEDGMRVSADYPGFFYTELERLTSPGCVAMLLNGAEGDQTCANPERKEGWERTESIGRLLAIRTKEAANAITPTIPTLRVNAATVELPLSLADHFMPASTFLQTVEIDDLLLAFFPGEPCVELGLELRRQALQRGYKAQFSVGLANDHLLYFVPRALYSHLIYESAMNVYGPGIDRWFYRHFGQLMSRGDAAIPAAPHEGPKIDLLGPAQRVVLHGSARVIGEQRGALFREAIQDAYAATILRPLDDGTLLLDAPPYTVAPKFVDLSVLALPLLGIGARPLLTGLAAPVFDELEGAAEGAGMPFDAYWLLQCAPVFAERHILADRYRSPFCTMLAVVGNRAGADDLLVARNLDWPGNEAPVILDLRPDTGHRFVQIGFSWNTGVYTGMNDAGLVVAAERVPGLGQPSIDGPPLELVLREALQFAAGAKEAQAILATHPHLRGYHVLLASPDDAAALVIELGPATSVRTAADGLLLGQDPALTIDDEAQSRYTRVNHLLQEERIVSVPELQRLLADTHGPAAGRARIFNGDTRHSVVFEPKARRLHVSFPEPDGSFAYHSVDLGGNGS
jgi:hypothetical protein